MPVKTKMTISFNGTVNEAADLGMVLGDQRLLSQQNVVSRQGKNKNVELLVVTFDSKAVEVFTKEYISKKGIDGLEFSYTH